MVSEIETHVEGLHRIALTRDGKSVCVVSVKTGDLLFYDIRTHKLEKKMNMGKGAGLYVDKKQQAVYFLNA